MACNCKKKFDLIDEKYGDGNNDEGKKSILTKIAEFMLQLLFGAFCGVAIVVLIVPMIIYLIFCIMFGRDAKFKIKNLNKYMNKDAQNG